MMSSADIIVVIACLCISPPAAATSSAPAVEVFHRLIINTTCVCCSDTGWPGLHRSARPSFLPVRAAQHGRETLQLCRFDLGVSEVGISYRKAGLMSVRCQDQIGDPGPQG